MGERSRCPRCYRLLWGKRPEQCDCYVETPYECIECGELITTREFNRWGMCSWCGPQNDPNLDWGEDEEDD